MIDAISLISLSRFQIALIYLRHMEQSQSGI